MISIEECLRRVRDALQKEKESLAATKKELEDLKEAITLNATVDDIL